MPVRGDTLRDDGGVGYRCVVTLTGTMVVFFTGAWRHAPERCFTV
jgi:hypothetical protein